MAPKPMTRKNPGQPPGAKKSRSGTQWTEADYRAAGYTRLSVRLTTEVKARLQRLAEMSGWSIAELVDHLSAAEEKRRKTRASKKST